MTKPRVDLLVHLRLSDEASSADAERDTPTAGIGGNDWSAYDDALGAGF